MPRTKDTRNPIGSIFRREIKKDGKKVIVYDARKRYRDPDGKQKEKFKRCRSMQEATTALANFQNEIAAEAVEAIEKKEQPKEYTFFELTAYFRREYLVEPVFVNERQIAGYRQDLTKLDNMIKDFESFFGDIAVKAFNYEMIRSYTINLATSPKKSKNATEPPKQSTINRKTAVLRKMLNVAIQLGWLERNPFNQGKPLIDTKAERNRTRILTYDEERRLLAACTGDQFVTYKRKGKEITANVGPIREHLRPIIIMAIDTGMRKGEIFAVERGQIDLDNRMISLRAEQTKGLKARSMPISERLYAELVRYFEGKTIAANEPIFGGVKNCRKAFESACEAAGIKDLVFHDLRHTATTWLDEAGVTEAVKKNIVGHSSDVVHQKYNNLSSDILMSVKEKIDTFRKKVDEELEQQNLKKAA